MNATRPKARPWWGVVDTLLAVVVVVFGLVQHKIWLATIAAFCTGVLSMATMVNWWLR